MLPNAINAVYILAPGHSGSTLLNLIVGAHSRAVAVSEITSLPQNIAYNEKCTCGRTVRECAYWREVTERLRLTLGFNILRDPGRLELGFVDGPRPGYRGTLLYRSMWNARRIVVYLSQLAGLPLPRFMRRRFTLGIEHRLAVYRAVREASGASVVVDASKEYLQGIAVYERERERTRLILLTRDGRAVFYSNLKRGFGHSPSLNAWRNYYRHALPVINRRVDRKHILSVRYEDIATDPETHIRHICNFVGLEYEPSMLDTSTKESHITSGNNMRFDRSTGIRLDTNWRSQLQDSDRAYFERYAGALNRELGYE